MAKLTVPIVVDWEGIKSYFDQHDIVEVVRCRDCKHWMDIDNGRQKHEMCAQLMPDWFCADGKRKETEDE